MVKREEYDRYAVEAAQRFDDFVNWAISNWPRENFPLLRSDFDASRRELGQILGPKLGEPDEPDQRVDESERAPDSRRAQYRNINPMPWP